MLMYNRPTLGSTQPRGKANNQTLWRSIIDTATLQYGDAAEEEDIGKSQATQCHKKFHDNKVKR